VLDNGICVHHAEDDETELFSVRKGDKNMRIIKDEGITGIVLAKNGTRTIGYRGNELYEISLRKS
jgi:hypothetical protein